MTTEGHMSADVERLAARSQRPRVLDVDDALFQDLMPHLPSLDASADDAGSSPAAADDPSGDAEHVDAPGDPVPDLDEIAGDDDEDDLVPDDVDAFDVVDVDDDLPDELELPASPSDDEVSEAAELDGAGVADPESVELRADRVLDMPSEAVLRRMRSSSRSGAASAAFETHERAPHPSSAERSSVASVRPRMGQLQVSGDTAVVKKVPDEAVTRLREMITPMVGAEMAAGISKERLVVAYLVAMLDLDEGMLDESTAEVVGVMRATNTQLAVLMDRMVRMEEMLERINRQNTTLVRSTGASEKTLNELEMGTSYLISDRLGAVLNAGVSPSSIEFEQRSVQAVRERMREQSAVQMARERLRAGSSHRLG